jgi:hypothetical protein
MRLMGKLRGLAVEKLRGFGVKRAGEVEIRK